MMDILEIYTFSILMNMSLIYYKQEGITLILAKALPGLILYYHSSHIHYLFFSAADMVLAAKRSNTKLGLNIGIILFGLGQLASIDWYTHKYEPIINSIPWLFASNCVMIVMLDQQIFYLPELFTPKMFYVNAVYMSRGYRVPSIYFAEILTSVNIIIEKNHSISMIRFLGLAVYWCGMYLLRD